MSNYVQNTNFATKDALPSGDSLKIVRGTEINIEFNNIATAVATKADLLSPTFTGTPILPTGTTAVTQITTNNSTLLATTAFVQAVKESLYPIGSIYINANVATNPATLLGFGTWAQFAAGRMMMGVGGAFGAGATGGSNDATLVSHNHTATSTVSDPGHNHTRLTRVIGSGGGSARVWGTDGLNNGDFTDSVNNAVTGITVSTSIANNGSSATNANLPPFIVVYMWQRTA